MSSDAAKWFLIASAIVGLNAAAWAEDLDIGKSEFQSSCAACHGADGKGKGPMSAELKATPPDLTVLAKKNNGVFPVGAVYETIDGRKSVSAHSTREMPIWGIRYLPTVQEWLAQPSGNLSGFPEFIIRSRILALIDYLNRIQEK